MKKILTLAVFAFTISILFGLPGFAAFLIAGMIVIFGTLAFAMYKYFTAPGPPEEPLPLRIIKRNNFNITEPIELKITIREEN